MNPNTAAATDVTALLEDMDGGQLSAKLGAVLSQVAAAAVDNAKSGKVTIELTLAPIKGTTQIACSHKLAFTRPTMAGKASEEETRETVLHVGKFGRLTLTQPRLLDNAQAPIPGTASA